jgi:hypothetical protein
MKNNPTAARTGAASGHAELRAVCCVDALVCTVRVEGAPDVPGVTGVDEKVPVAPAGSPLTVNATGLVNVPPVDVTVTVYVVAPPGATDCDAGVALTVKSAGLMPLPESATVCGEPAALSAIESVAAKLPAAAAVNVTLMLQEAPAASVLPHGVLPAVIAKSVAFVPVIEIPVIVNGAFPLFVRVTVVAALVTPIVWLANATGLGASVTTGAGGGVPVPVSVDVCGELAALSVT